MSETTKASVFKSARSFVQIKLPGFGMIAFRNHRYLTTDKAEAEAIKKHLVTDKALGIFVDPNEAETDSLPPGTDKELRQQQLQEFITAQTQTFDGGNYQQSGVTPASSKDVSGKSMTAPHFTSADTSALMAAKDRLANLKQPK